VTAPFSLVVEAHGLPAEGRHYRVSPTPEQRDEIAQRLGAVAIDAFEGEAVVRPAPGGAMVEGCVRARLVRHCVVTLDPVEETVEEPFTVRFRREDAAAPAEEIEIDADTPEPLDPAGIDIAELLVQQLALAMDPYPRRPDAAFDAAEFGGAAETSPFAVLKGAIARARDQE